MVVNAMQVVRIVIWTSSSSRKCWTTLPELSVCWRCPAVRCYWLAVAVLAAELLSCWSLTCITWNSLRQRSIAATALSSSRLTWKRLLLCLFDFFIDDKWERSDRRYFWKNRFYEFNFASRNCIRCKFYCHVYFTAHSLICCFNFAFLFVCCYS